MPRSLTLIIISLILLATPAHGGNESIHIAVASNFVSTLEKLVRIFENQNNSHVIISQGATGTLHTQIIYGAPFDIFLAADVFHPKKLEENNLAIPDSRFTYAIGMLALWHPDSHIPPSAKLINSEKISHIILANPTISPYGKAAKQSLAYLKLWNKKQSMLVQGKNISQAFQFTERVSKTIGFVARSQLLQHNIPTSQYWIIPANYHAPIQQQAILLKNTPATKQFISFLASAEAQRIILNDGYMLEKE